MKERLLSSEAEIRPPYRCTLRMGRHGVNYYSQEDQFVDSFLSNPEYSGSFPGWQISFNPVDGPIVIYQPASLSNIEYQPSTNTLEVRGKPEDYANGQSLAYLGFWLLEAERQKENIFTLHSSAFAVEGKGVLLLGHSGSGKTTVMLDFARRYSTEIVSNDLTVMENQEKIWLNDGTKEIRLRLASVYHHFPEWVCLFPDSEKSPWENKAAFQPEQFGLVKATQPYPLEKIFVIHLDKNSDLPLQLTPINDIAIRYYLYEDISRIIRGNAISVFGADCRFLGYTPSLDTPDIHSRRVAAIKKMVEEIGIFSISGGNLQKVCQAIYEKIST